jgi:hypothetical protein
MHHAGNHSTDCKWCTYAADGARRVLIASHYIMQFYFYFFLNHLSIYKLCLPTEWKGSAPANYVQKNKLSACNTSSR